MDQKKTVRPFSMKDKIGYTLGDLGCCFTEQYRAMYLSIFYTLILQVIIGTIVTLRRFPP